jgi:hypothetical protein
MANILRGGFHIRRGKGQPRRYEVASNNTLAVFAGDAVDLVTAGVVYPAIAGTATVLGVVSHCSYVVNGTRVFSNYIPASTVYSPTARGSKNASYAYVWDNPDNEYIVDVNVATTEALNRAGVGANMDLLATAGSTVYGRSGHLLDGTYVAGTAQFRIIEMFRQPGNDLTAVDQKVVCQINEGFHAFFNAAGI